MVLIMEIQGKNNFNVDSSVANMVEGIVGCKWSLSILQQLRLGVNRPGQMLRQVEGLSQKVLNERLTKLNRFGIIEKKVFPEIPPHVEYFFTDFGEKFLVIIDAVEKVQRELDGCRE